MVFRLGTIVYPLPPIVQINAHHPGSWNSPWSGGIYLRTILLQHIRNRTLKHLDSHFSDLLKTIILYVWMLWLHICVLCIYVPCLCTVYVSGTHRSQRGHQIPWVTDGWEPSYGGWELKPSPLKEQPIFLTTEPSLTSVVVLWNCILILKGAEKTL